MTPITDDFQVHLGIAGIITGLIEVAKRTNFPGLGWITVHSTGISAALSVGLAFITTLGFQWTWEGTWPDFASLLQNGGVMNLSLTIPSVDTLVRAVGQVMLNLGVYNGVLKPLVNKPA